MEENKMKIRNGFVSNSSSASFIITWKPKVSTDNDLKRMFSRLTEGDYLREEKGKDVYSFVEENTTIESGAFCTRDFTSMMNSMEDFDPRIFVLLAYLATNSQFEYSVLVDNDNG